MAATASVVNMRRVVNVVADHIFPRSVNKNSDIQQEYLIRQGQEYVSNLPLQMLLYFNLFYYPFWIITESVMLATKFYSLSILYKIIIIAILACMTIVEVIRLYTGYVGNLTEKVPELFASWLLTLLIQFPLVLFLLLNEATIITPLERSVTIIMTLFYAFEVIFGYFALRVMVNYQATKFHLQQFTNLEKIDPSEFEYYGNGFSDGLHNR